MRFLIDADLPRGSKSIFEFYGHEAIDCRDIGLRVAKDPVIASYAKENGLTLVTGDFGFANIRNYPPEEFQGIVVLELPRNADASVILNLLEKFLQQEAIIARLRGRLAVVRTDRIRVRPA